MKFELSPFRGGEGVSRGIKFIDLKKNGESLNFSRSTSPNSEEQRKNLVHFLHNQCRNIHYRCLFVTKYFAQIAARWPRCITDVTQTNNRHVCYMKIRKSKENYYEN
jgi:hypothetical protein